MTFKEKAVLPMVVTSTSLRGCGEHERTAGQHPTCSVTISQVASRSIFSSTLPPVAVTYWEAPLAPLFTQLSELWQEDDDNVMWKETARWIKFEEKVEDGGERWSRPHVTTFSLHSVFEFRTCIMRGAVLLDMEASNLKQLVETLTSITLASCCLDPSLQEKIEFVLLQEHLHQSKMSRLRTVKGFGRRLSRQGKEVPIPQEENNLLNSPTKKQLKNKFKKKIPEGSEAFNILVGELDFLEKPFVSFLRMKQAVLLGELTEVPLATRFLFILLGPRGKANAYREIGRAAATLLTDELYHNVALKANNKEELIAGIDEFLDELTVLPPGRWDPTVRIKPPKYLPSLHKRMHVYAKGSTFHLNKSTSHSLGPGHVHEISDEMMKTGRCFGGFINDIKRKAPWYWSDFYDGLNLQCLPVILFIYLATVTNAITFGGMLGDATDNFLGVLESFIGTSVAGALFCLFAGQPLTILSSTGPVLVFERLLFNFCRQQELDYLELRLWIGLWTAFFCLVLVATDASYLVQYFTRFTEEGFCTLISLIFIYDAIKKMLSLAQQYPIHAGYFEDESTQYSCTCTPPLLSGNSSVDFNQTLVSSQYSTASNMMANWTTLGKKECMRLGGALVGESCAYVPDVTLMSFLLFFGTFILSLILKNFKDSSYFPQSVRKLISDFSIILVIVIFCIINFLVGIQTPQLLVPSEFKPTNPTRQWYVSPFKMNPWWLSLVSAIPAILLTILVFMDQQITAVILNRKELKLKKGAGIHLDFFWIAVLMVLMSVLGFPWYISSTVISLAHMNGLKMEDSSLAPGEEPKFVGIREQRLTGLAVFLLTGFSVFLAPVLKYIPMPVLYGIFLYMGVSAVSSLQFLDRLKLFFIPAKHQPDLIFLRHVPLYRVHIFTFIQVLCLVLLWILKSTSAAIIFPIMLLALVAVRKAMEWIFSCHDLSWLDDILPEEVHRNETPLKKVTQHSSDSDSENSEMKYQEKAPEINISVN
ncbi:electrogenic sodium bicarbonate cotransporter 1-like [Erpetoichthys calabaricus]|uniref:Anion exchange protein n=1 Tax=Erpetoichthys calabaricus TaxID=27687 RepID=A0A8C4SB85_ERPCA|nr:electrogenic sodium bicarbonate cotransporter 1-like [Erpetoichthys calabaricus]